MEINTPSLYPTNCLQTFWDEVKDKVLVVLKTLSDSSSSSSASLSPSLPPGPSTLLYPPPLVSLLQLPHVWWLFLTFTKLHMYDNEGRKVTTRVVSLKQCDVMHECWCVCLLAC